MWSVQGQAATETHCSHHQVQSDVLYSQQDGLHRAHVSSLRCFLVYIETANCHLRLSLNAVGLDFTLLVCFYTLSRWCLKNIVCFYKINHTCYYSYSLWHKCRKNFTEWAEEHIFAFAFSNDTN